MRIAKLFICSLLAVGCLAGCAVNQSDIRGFNLISIDEEKRGESLLGSFSILGRNDFLPLVTRQLSTLIGFAAMFERKPEPGDARPLARGPAGGGGFTGARTNAPGLPLLRRADLLGPEHRHRPADAGAVIVSGSQSHVPLQMEFYKGAFIHYGLGNLFFGQMGNQPPGPGLP